MYSHSRKRRGKDFNRINVREDHEVQYWAKELGVDQKTLTSAVKAVGASIDRVREYVLSRSAGDAGIPTSARREGSA